MAPSELTCDCSETIVKAHTISRSRSLKMISREGFVYAIKTDLVKFNKQGSRFAFALNTTNQSLPTSKKTFFSTTYNRTFCSVTEDSVAKSTPIHPLLNWVTTLYPKDSKSWQPKNYIPTKKSTTESFCRKDMMMYVLSS
jgi:hypothetical protein